MLNVFLTIDAEFWWQTTTPSTPVSADIQRDIYGHTARGEYGLRYQIDRLNHYGLRATYFVESLSPCVVGLEPLRDIVHTIRDGGHDIQLHLHPEWIAQRPCSNLPEYRGSHLRQYTLPEQTALIARALANLRTAGADSPTAFRAGNWGANLDTLRALASLGIIYDSSHNIRYSARHFASHRPLVQPLAIDGVYEVPVSAFRVWPHAFRPAHLNGCSTAELCSALWQAWRGGWSTFVIVTHTFELLDSRRTGPDPVMVRRFETVCRFLAANPDKFTTSGFADVAPRDLLSSADTQVPKSNVLHTAHRVAEQLVRRCFM